MVRKQDYQPGFDSIDLTPEQFMSLEPQEHVFSESYQQRKKLLLQRLDAKTGRRIRRGGLPKIAVVAAIAACLAIPAGAYAVVSHTDFFSGAFGTGWRSGHQAEEVTVDPGGDKAPYLVIYPGSEPVPVDQEMAERLLGDAILSEPLTVTTLDGHVLTIESVVRSEYTLVYSFTLQRDGGVTALEWNDMTNNVAAKGAYMPHDQQMSWNLGGDSFLYVDPTTSTEDELHGYGYSVLGKALGKGKPVSLVVNTCEVPFNEDFSEAQFHMDEYSIPCTDVVESLTFENAGGGRAELSPLGLSFDTRTGLFPSVGKGEYDRAQDPINILAVMVELKDGSSYTVFDRTSNLDNSLSACCFMDGDGWRSNPQFTLAFNRLIDPDEVANVEIRVVDVPHDNDDRLMDGNGNWLPIEQWPSKTVSYSCR